MQLNALHVSITVVTRQVIYIMPKPTTFTHDSLSDFFSGFPQLKQLWIAFSGGMDSRVLLHAVSRIQSRLPHVTINAVHVDHGLNEQSKKWSSQCEAVCNEYGITYFGITVDAKPLKGESPEAAARDARYKAFADIMGEGDYFVTAHHQDDQAETFLLQLARGSGLSGLASMAVMSPFHKGMLVRPLLAYTRARLSEYASNESLTWIDDPSNFDKDFDRNFIRHNVMPVLNERWAQLSSTVSRSARHIAEADQLLRQLAESDINRLRNGPGDTLSVTALLALDDARRNNALRFWIKNLGLPVPQTVQLQHINQNILLAKPDAQPSVNWSGCEVRRYQDQLYAMSPLSLHDARQNLQWKIADSLEILDVGILSASVVVGQGLKRGLLISSGDSSQESVMVRFRQGGEQCRPAGRNHTHDLKKLFQEYKIPHWQRERIPLLYINDTLAGIVGYCYCENFVAKGNEPGLEINFESV